MESPKILIIDDDPQVGRAVGGYLQRQGFSVETASGGKQGLVLALQNKPDLIICDLNMPDLEGRTVARMLRQQSQLSQTPLVFLSATQDQEIIRQSMNLGGDDFIIKPVDPTVILVTVQARLARRNQQQAAAEKDLQEAVHIFSSIINDLDKTGNFSLWVDDAHGENQKRLKALLTRWAPGAELPPDASKGDTALLIKDKNRREFIQLSQVKAFLANGEYSVACWGDSRRSMFRKAIRTWAKELPKNFFVRIHRATIINLNYLDHVKTSSEGQLLVRLRGMDEIFQVSHRARPIFNKAIKEFQPPPTPA
jgi:CheY-like chemotaxis protein